MAASNMAEIKQEFDSSAVRLHLEYLKQNGAADHVKVKWGKGYIWVVKLGGKPYPYKGGLEFNMNLKKKIVSLYIDMSKKV